MNEVLPSEGPLFTAGGEERIILVLDDDAILLRSLEILLGRFGRVVSCNSSAQAVELLYEGLKPHIILADYQMPELTGLEVLFESRDYAPEAIRIIMTGFGGLKEVLEGLNRGYIDLYLCKPWRTEDFLETIRQCFEQCNQASLNRRLRDELAEQEAGLADLRAGLQVLNEKVLARRDAGRDNLARTARVFGALFGDHPGAHHGSHSAFVGRLSGAIAEAIGLSREEVHDVRLAGFLHDIGKSALPESLRGADPKNLSDEAHALYQTHVARGLELLDGIPSLERVREIIAHHHERTDGSGFPRGLKGRQIVREGQIVAMADLYHNLVFRTEPASDDDVLPAWRAEMRRQSASAYFKAHRGLFDARVYVGFWAVAHAGTVPDFILHANPSASTLHAVPAS